MSVPNLKNNGAVDVLIVTVTKVEARAVLSLAESKYKAQPKRFYDQKTYYDLGLIGDARVVMVRSEMGVSGTAGSQATVTAAIRDLSPTSIIMVGIAFGVEREEQEVGRILVSQHIQEYELQKVGTQNQVVNIHPRGERVQSSPKLLDRFRDGELYWSEAEVTFGLMLSGSKLIDNLDFRDKLLEMWPEAIGGEMEGFGVYAAASIEKLDWIIVKAVCDWADGNKGENKLERQELAADNAAKFVLFVVSRGGLARTSPLPDFSHSELKSTQLQTVPAETANQPPTKKSVIIAYIEVDVLQALKLSEEIEKALNKSSVDIEFFELNSNFQLTNYISSNNYTDKWFLFLVSKNSVDSNWFKLELRSETLLDLERRKYHVVIAQLDDTLFPDTAESILQERRKISLKDNNDKVIELLQSNTNTRADKIEFFVNRGQELDQLELAITRSKIIYLIGVPGIGKSSLLRAAARSRFHRDIIQVNLSPGHDLELLAREVIAETGNVQPSELFSDSELMKISVNKVLERVVQGSVLFINNAQHAMTTEGSLRKYLQGFINALIDQEIAFPIIISSTRRTEISPEESSYVEIIRINRLADDFMYLIVRHWLASSNQTSSAYADSDLKVLVEQLEGFPLAARMIIGYLAFDNPKKLVQNRFISRFQRKVAEYIVSSILPQLYDIDQTILQALAIFGSGMSTRQLLTIKSIASKGTENVQDSIEKLMSLMLINQSIDVIELQPLLISYFSDKALHQNTYETLALELADFSWKEVKRISEDMALVPKKDRNADNKDYLRLSKKLLKIAEPAHRLLLTTRQNTKASQIPFRLRGHLREMVLVMYQQAKDYKACTEFAQEWLKIDPTDSEILLYQARAFRQLRDYDKSTEILEAI